MTVVAGVVTKGRVYIATDTIITFDSGYCRDDGRDKFLDLPTPDLLVAYSGALRNIQILQQILSDPEGAHLLDVRSIDDVEKIAHALLENVSAFGVGPSPENSLPTHEGNFLVASAYCPALFTIEADYSVHAYEDNIAIGSGGQIADTAMLALEYAGVARKKALGIAMSVACERSPYCGGSIILRDVKLKSPD